MRRSSPLAPARRKVRPKVPDAVRAEVKALTHGRCALCLFDGVPRRRAPRIVHLHHVFDAQAFPELVKLAANLMGLCLRCHERHTLAVRRVPREALRPETLRLAEDFGPRLNHLDRFYPPVADAGRNPADAWEVRG